MGNVCAYCGKAGKLTKEHLYPQFLNRYMGTRFLGYNEAADKVTVGERVIRDVCFTCNNESLGALDGYGHQYFQANKLEQVFTEEKVTEVLYDYDLLLRWVLKISYNSFRTVDFSDDPFVSLLPYILTGKNRPKPKFVKLLIEVIRGHKLTDDERPRFSPRLQKTGYLPCHILCSGRVMNCTPAIPCHLRHFQLNAHRFTLCLFPYSTRSAQSDHVVRIFRRQFPFAVTLNQDSTKMPIRISRRDIVEIHAGPAVYPWQRFREQQYDAEHP